MIATRTIRRAMQATAATDESRQRRMLIALAALLTLAVAWPAAPALAQQTTGTWETREWETDGDDRREADWVYLNLKLDRDNGTWNMGTSIDVANLRGITAEALRGSPGDVEFEIVREAGTIAFDGEVRDGRGTGFFTFTPDSAYLQRMAGLGYSDLSAERKFVFAAHDVTTQYVGDLQALGYRDLAEGDLVKFAIHRVTTDFISGMNDLGYRDIEPSDLVKLRIHGVNLDWIRRVRDALGSD